MPPQSTLLNPIQHFWYLVEREIHIMNLQQLCDAIIIIQAKIGESMPWKMKKKMNEYFLKVKTAQPYQGVPNKMSISCILKEQ